MKLRHLSCSLVAALLVVSCGKKSSSETNVSGEKQAQDLLLNNKQLDSTPVVTVKTDAGVITVPVNTATALSLKLQKKDLDFISNDFLTLCNAQDTFEDGYKTTVKGLHKQFGKYFDTDTNQNPTCNPKSDYVNNPFITQNGVFDISEINGIDQIAMDNLYNFGTDCDQAFKSNSKSNYNCGGYNTAKSKIWHQGSVYQGQQGSVYQGQQGSVYQGQQGSVYQGQQGSVYQGQQGSVYQGQQGSVYQSQQGQSDCYGKDFCNTKDVIVNNSQFDVKGNIVGKDTCIDNIQGQIDTKYYNQQQSSQY